MRIEQLTFFRFIAAIAAVNLHFGIFIFGNESVLAAGSEAVTFFFVLSGFVIGITSSASPDFSVYEFYWRRCVRILPLYLISLLLTVVLSYGVTHDFNRTQLLREVLLIQAWTPASAGFINDPGWSLSVEAFFYLIFPIYIYCSRKLSVSGLSVFLAAIVLWLSTQVLLIVAGNTAYLGAIDKRILFYFPIMHLSSFMLGVSGAIFFTRGWHLRINNAIHVFMPFLCVVVFMAAKTYRSELQGYLGFKLPYTTCLFAPLFLVFIVCISSARARLLNYINMPIFVLLGEASYAVYTMQVPLYHIHKRYLAGKLYLSYPVDYLIYLLFLVAASIAIHVSIERPFSIFMRGRMPNYLKMKITL